MGYYGLANNIAMSFGPMTGLFMHTTCSYEAIFACSFISGSLGIVMASLVKVPRKPPVRREPVSLDPFSVGKRITCWFFFVIASIPYGMTTTYVAMYAEEIGIQVSPGLYFTFMAVGLAVSRIFQGSRSIKGRSRKLSL